MIQEYRYSTLVQFSTVMETVNSFSFSISMSFELDNYATPKVPDSKGRNSLMK